MGIATAAIDVANLLNENKEEVVEEAVKVDKE
jgi:hypothetical protein